MKVIMVLLEFLTWINQDLYILMVVKYYGEKLNRNLEMLMDGIT